MGRNGFAENKQGNGFAGMHIMLMVYASRTHDFPSDSNSLQQKKLTYPHAIFKIAVLRFKTISVTFWSALAPL
jgi:hypothetical protein